MAVVFDMDGVLCDTGGVHLKAFQELAAEHGITFTAEQFQTMFGMANRAFIPRMFGKEMDLESIDRLADQKESRYRELIAHDIEPSPGVRELVDWLKSKSISMAVASSAPRATVEQIMSVTGLETAMRAMLGAEDVERHKPDPLVYLSAAHQIGSEPDHTWVIEDSLHGIQAGLAAGMTTIAVATTHPAEELEIADLVLRDMHAVLDLLRNLPASD